MASEWLVSPPSPLTHEDNREFLRMLREKKERYKCAYQLAVVVVVCVIFELSRMSNKSCGRRRGVAGDELVATSCLHGRFYLAR
jgi:hypothetical protein